MKLKNLFIIEEEDNKEPLDNSIFEPSNGSLIPNLSSEEKSWAIIAHISAVFGYIIPFGNIIAPFVVLHLKKDESEFIAGNARSAFNFQLSITFFLLVLILSSFFIMGGFNFFLNFFAAYFMFILIELIFIALALMNVSKGKIHKYPLTIDIIKKF